ncbi:PAS domain-containing sensor histidine kinase [Mucilaginibacter achroorhodeus]|uniref:histidine kinase n=1 Tax=Mucilaginibacter achroorhodeus TaxID=2599294 RepID=A0A563U6P8_9SPHI|nr:MULTISPECIES: PAS domain-containing sensor histidine kinase [Mucilaginibacter]QXV64870.1 PAS domain-containing sensor histidine kinase [Mucilaginibacter sp. 21P]TWR27018.1 PAS domain-containing sensor histidine kinase [Mucilaginibacter achroorhodeus]
MNITQVKDPQGLLAIIKNLPGNYLVVLPNYPTFTIVEITEAYNEATYTTRDEIIGKGIFEVFPNVPGDELADGEQNLTASFQRVIATLCKDEMPVQRYPVRLPDDGEFVERFWVPVNTPVVLDGKLEYIIHSITDVTESKLLKSRERYFKALADESPYMIWRSAGVSCIYVNDAWMKLTGTSHDENLGAGTFKAIHPDDTDEQRKLFHDAVKNSGSYETKFRVIDKANGLHWLSMKVVPLHIDGSLVEFVASMIDITEQEIADQRIRQSEMLLRQMADAIIQMVWVTDANGMHEYYNQRWYDFTGTSYEESEGEGWNQVFHPDDQQRAWNTWRHSLQTGTPYEIEYRLRKYTGEYIWVLGRAAPYFDEHGKIIKWFGTCTDINDQKLLQQQKDDFINIASHELKTPLTSLSANIQVIERALLKGQSDNSSLIKLVNSCFKNVKKLNKIIADLLEANSIGLGQLSINASTFDVVQLIHETAGNLNIANTKVNITGESAAIVYADTGKIEQVMINLINNALKYASESKMLTIDVNRSLTEMIKVSITDQGKGIEEEKLKFLFDRYYRADVRSAQYSGMGLGLYVCAKIIHGHGGEIGVDSKVGKGSTFWFTLPPGQSKALIN